MPRVMAFPKALGTGMIARPSGSAATDTTAANALEARIAAFIGEYESVLSRFRDDSTVATMGRATRGGRFEFPDWAAGLFDLVDALVDTTDGAIDPCVGEDLIRLGYDARYSFALADDATTRLGAIHGRPTWRDDVTRNGDHGTTLVTRRPVHLDFGACGKGYLVDLVAAMTSPTDCPYLLIDAGGDLFVRSPHHPVTIALEDPSDTTRAVGTATVTHGALCASAPSRRHWRSAGGLELHHLINAIDGRPVDDVAATWTYVDADPAVRYPTALADGLATALFVADPNALAARFGFECAILRPDRTASVSRGFPGSLFTH
ncbi:FAD:protein FMN transferase [Bifidobacterium aerophilum]|uniref:FAD:protein FMN transferase n=2 Tax=Bifidobacterium aerophilum TaxID=1798155 RepID=A0A6N9Z5Z2_9BIFI|nr:FAD:protein FMN transferase [Bifidobacterium aerophilum]